MITWVLAMEIAQRHKAVLLVNFGLKVSIVLKEGHVHTHVYVCVCVHMCVCERQLYQQAASFIYIYEGRVQSPLSSLLHWSWEKNSAMTHHTLLHLQRSREDEQASLMTSQGERVMPFSLKKMACCCWGWQLITNHITIKYLNLYWPETHWIMILNSLLLLLSVSVQVGKQLLVSQARVQKYFVWPQGISNDFIDPLSFMFLCCGQNH